jgi:2-haloacid dehalogenase
MAVLAFDVYGTLINTYGMVDLLQRYIGEEKAMPFATLWRDKQLEYSFRRSMMDRYEPFYTCTTNALDYCIDTFQVTITRDQHFSLVKKYQNLPVFKDVIASLESLSERSDLELYAFTNGPLEDVEKLFEDNGINQFFRDIVSADEIRKFKPDPLVYQHFLKRSGGTAEDSYLVSGNAFDIIGALNAGMKSIWVRRSEIQRMDPWGGSPTHRIQSLAEINSLL